MKAIRYTDTLSVSREDLVACLDDPHLVERITDRVPLLRHAEIITLQHHRDSRSKVIRAHIELPHFAHKVMKTRSVSYDVEYQLDKGLMKEQVVVDSSFFQANVHIDYQRMGKDETGRRITGELSTTVRFIGSLMERAMHASMVQLFDAEGRILNELVTARDSPAPGSGG